MDSISIELLWYCLLFLYKLLTQIMNRRIHCVIWRVVKYLRNLHRLVFSFLHLIPISEYRLAPLPIVFRFLVFQSHCISHPIMSHHALSININVPVLCQNQIITEFCVTFALKDSGIRGARYRSDLSIPNFHWQYLTCSHHLPKLGISVTLSNIISIAKGKKRKKEKKRKKKLTIVTKYVRGYPKVEEFLHSKIYIKFRNLNFVTLSQLGNFLSHPPLLS